MGARRNTVLGLAASIAFVVTGLLASAEAETTGSSEAWRSPAVGALEQPQGAVPAHGDSGRRAVSDPSSPAGPQNCGEDKARIVLLWSGTFSSANAII